MEKELEQGAQDWLVDSSLEIWHCPLDNCLMPLQMETEGKDEIHQNFKMRKIRLFRPLQETRIFMIYGKTTWNSMTIAFWDFLTLNDKSGYKLFLQLKYTNIAKFSSFHATIIYRLSSLLFYAFLSGNMFDKKHLF